MPVVWARNRAPSGRGGRTTDGGYPAVQCVRRDTRTPPATVGVEPLSGNPLILLENLARQEGLLHKVRCEQTFIYDFPG